MRDQIVYVAKLAMHNRGQRGFEGGSVQGWRFVIMPQLLYGVGLSLLEEMVKL